MAHDVQQWGDHQLKVLSAIEAGRSLSQAAAFAGVSRALVYKWRKHDEEYAKALNRARNEGSRVLPKDPKKRLDARHQKDDDGKWRDWREVLADAYIMSSGIMSDAAQLAGQKHHEVLCMLHPGHPKFDARLAELIEHAEPIVTAALYDELKRRGMLHSDGMLRKALEVQDPKRFGNVGPSGSQQTPIHIQISTQREAIKVINASADAAGDADSALQPGPLQELLEAGGQ
jgi:hypothetical protein